MRALVQFCWLLTGIATGLAALFLFTGVTTATGAPQEAAAAALAAAFVIIPYVFTRAVEGLFNAPPPAPPARQDSSPPPSAPVIRPDPISRPLNF